MTPQAFLGQKLSQPLLGDIFKYQPTVRLRCQSIERNHISLAVT